MSEKGIAFYLLDDYKKDKQEIIFHLYFVISEPDIDNKVLIVNCTTCHGKIWEDTTCILEVGDHPKIRHKSYINYAKAQTKTIYDLDRILTERERPIPKLDEIILDKIQEGAKLSEALPEKFKKYFEYF